IGMNWNDAFTDSGDLSSANRLETLAVGAGDRCRMAFEQIASVFNELISKEGKSWAWISEAQAGFSAKRGEWVYGPDDTLIKIFEDDPANTVKKLNTKECAISLREIVVLPDSELAGGPGASRATKRTLQRYLTGSGLLGAEHLQYPENI